MLLRLGLGLPLLSAALGALLPGGDAAVASGHGPVGTRGAAPVQEEGCLECHSGIEEMHPGFPLSCVDCHGGDPDAKKKSEAHVPSKRSGRRDERVAPLRDDLAHVRFVNPMDLRVAEDTCGDCHGELVEHLMISLHGTTAAHLSDGYFETGIQPTRESRYAVFPASAPAGSDAEHAVERLVQPPRLDPSDDPADLASHFPDLIRKECMQCHLWSQGRAVRGRVGFDGEYRGAGCAACHVPYRTDGLSESLDPTANRTEPGHPRAHAMVTAPPTETCTTCHYGDASIGLHFRGLSQLPPGAPGGPEIEGTTDSLLHRAFFVNDPEVTPPDVHHASGLHCVDCHTLGGVMGDGRMLSKMEEATEITCQACHGTFDERSTMTTERGNRLRHLFAKDDGSVWMKSKVTGAEHRIKQAVDVVTVGHPDYNEAAKEAMTSAHGEVACYTCHAGWNVNFLGFHFYRNEALTQLDLLSGERTKGRVTTQEKVFTTWKSFYAGLDERGRVSPYLTGFSTMGTVDAEDGTRILDQELPVTANGLSGMTMIHHQLHSTRPTARSCVECHRASETWGMGSGNFRLGRQLAFAADRRGVEVLAYDRENPLLSAPLAKFVLPDVIDIEVRTDHLQGHADVLFVTEGKRGVHAIDVSDPRAPRRLDFHMAVSPRGLALSGSHLYVADGIGGLKIFDVSDAAAMKRVATVPMVDAHDVEIRFPHAYVADGAGGLVVVDVRFPVAPRIVGGLELEGEAATSLDVLFQYSRPIARDGAPADERTPARRLVAVCDEDLGPILVDATEPGHLKILEQQSDGRSAAESRSDGALYTGVALRSHVDLASPQGGAKTVERDLLYFSEERTMGGGDQVTFLRVIDVTTPERQEQVARLRVDGGSEMLVHGAWYNPPFLGPRVFLPGAEGISVLDVANTSEPVILGRLPALAGAYVFRHEEFPLDRMLEPDGRRLKDVSHPGSRWLMRGEIERVLAVDGEALGTVDYYDQASIPAASSARAMFRRADRDGSGLLTGDELDRVGIEDVDADGDGRVTLVELGRFADTTGRTVAEELDEPLVPEAPEARTAPDGDLARLLDGIDPWAFDRSKNGRLDGKELKAAVFAALDLDGDRRLDVHELSRHPGPTRELRFGDAGAAKGFAVLDRNGGGTVGRREFKLRPEDVAALDRDGDGEVQLDLSKSEKRPRGGAQELPRAEWPTRRIYPVIELPVRPTVDLLLETFDGNGDGVLTKRELRRRPDLYVTMDDDRSSVIEADELERWSSRVLVWGLDTVLDDFLGRWDLDGDGEADESVLPEAARTLLRRRASAR